LFGTLFSIFTGHFDLLAHPAMLWGLIAVVFGILLVVFQAGFVAFVTNRYVMMALAAAGVLLAFVSMQHQTADTKAQLVASQAQVAVAQTQTQTATDAGASVTFKSLAQTKNAVHVAKINSVIAAAPKGTATDAVMDEIAAEDAVAAAQ
jgi:hypothetical protein